MFLFQNGHDVRWFGMARRSVVAERLYTGPGAFHETLRATREPLRCDVGSLAAAIKRSFHLATFTIHLHLLVIRAERIITAAAS